MKKLIKKILFGTIISFCIFSCHQEGIDKNSYKIKVEGKTSKELSDFFSEIEIIPLETSEKCVLNRCTHLSIINGKYYVQDERQHIVAVFSLDGEFIYSTKELKGRGPNKYLNCQRYTVNRQNGNIQVLDLIRHKIIEYDLQGNLVIQYEIPETFLPAEEFVYLSYGIYAFYFQSKKPFKYNRYVIFYSVKEGKIIKKISAPQTYYLAVKTNHDCFQRFNNTIGFSYSYPSCNDIYYLNTKSLDLECSYSLDFGKYNFNEESLKNVDKELHTKFIRDNSDHTAFVYDRMESEDYIIIEYSLKNKFYVLFFNKKNHRVRIKENGTKHSKEVLTFLSHIDRDYIYSMCSPNFVDQLITNDLLSSESRKRLREMKLTDNSVIIRYKLK
ncbi:6-bladed beta-propeller [Halosquirtibacter xylanolyticus]|uniref:6-bladed beta-propeller n=1 Tax=Halosquirtibacter xylanolyticus TaxID=3374599 RepID=UPI003747ACC0|nr:6-bladed beta-propeller [Prolixibacteraceae bacterium]